MDITHCTSIFLNMNQMQPDIYKVAPMAPASDSVSVIMPIGHLINIQCYNKTLVCLLETGDTRFPASTNSSSYICACASPVL